MKYFIIPILLILGISCQGNTAFQRSQLREDERLANHITREVASKISHKFDLIPFGSGGQMVHQIEMLMLAFESRHSLSENDAREILVESVEEFVSALNKNEQVRPFLANYPCTEKNIEIELYIHDAKGGPAPPNQSFNIGNCREGIIQLKSFDHITNSSNILVQETFNEAKEKLQDNFSQSLRKSMQKN